VKHSPLKRNTSRSDVFTVISRIDPTYAKDNKLEANHVCQILGPDGKLCQKLIKLGKNKKGTWISSVGIEHLKKDHPTHELAAPYLTSQPKRNKLVKDTLETFGQVNSQTSNSTLDSTLD
jgi:hypothetical protein